MTTFRPGWLQRQVAKCVASLDELPPKIRASLSNGCPPKRRLDCGCPDDGRTVYGCMRVDPVTAVMCDATRCGEHRDQPHNCLAEGASQ